jgi:hypothetical protein
MCDEATSLQMFVQTLLNKLSFPKYALEEVFCNERNSPLGILGQYF